MPHFMADSREENAASGFTGSCGTCCCKRATARRGETQKWSIDYAPWSVPLGGRGLSPNVEFFLEKASEDQRPDIMLVPETVLLALASGDTVANRQINATDPQGGTLTYAMVPLEGAASGVATLTPTGSFSYVPNPGWSGVDRMFYSVTDADGNARVGEIAIRVNSAPPAVQYPAPTATPAVSVIKSRASVDQVSHQTTFPLMVTPAAVVGDVYRLTIKQPALDCDCEPYFHVSCYDVAIVKC